MLPREGLNVFYRHSESGKGSKISFCISAGHMRSSRNACLTSSQASQLLFYRLKTQDSVANINLASFLNETSNNTSTHSSPETTILRGKVLSTKSD